MEHLFKVNNWECTDDACLQYQKKLSENSFDMIQFDEVPGQCYMVYADTINLFDYSDKEIENYVTGYYDSLDHLKRSYPDEAVNGIIAECIFEQQQWSSCNFCKEFKLEEEEDMHQFIIDYCSKN